VGLAFPWFILAHSGLFAEGVNFVAKILLRVVDDARKQTT
jgi:hypothetical protein